MLSAEELRSRLPRGSRLKVGVPSGEVRSPDPQPAGAAVRCDEEGPPCRVPEPVGMLNAACSVPECCCSSLARITRLLGGRSMDLTKSRGCAVSDVMAETELALQLLLSLHSRGALMGACVSSSALCQPN